MPEENLAWSEVIKKYRDFLSSTGYSKSSVKNYVSDLNHLVSWLDGLYENSSTPSQLTEANLRNYKGYVRHLYRAKPSISSRRISSLRTFLTWAKGEGLVEIEKVRTLSPVLRNPDETGIIDQFREYLKVSGYSVPTVKNYIVDLRHLISWIERNWEKFALSSINEQTLRSYRSYLKDKFKAKPSISARRLSSLKKFLIWANINGLVTEDLLTLAKKVIEEPVSQIPESLPPSSTVETALPILLAPTPRTLVSTPKELLAPTLPPTDLSSQRIHQKVLHHIKNTRPVWYRNYHNSRLSEVVHYSLLGVYLVLAGSFILYSLFIGPNLKKDDDLGKRLADLGDVLAATSPPSVLSFQGRLTDENAVPVSSSTKFVFRIYDAETGGTLKWPSKDWTLTPDQNGIFSVCLGNQTTTDDCLVNGTADTLFPTDLFTDNAALYLEIDVHNPPADPAETLSPRQRISSVSYALNAGSLDGFDSLSFLRSDASDNFTSGALTTDAGTTLDVNGTLAWGGATISEGLNMSNNIISNIGNAGTDFIATTGGLTLAGAFTANGTATFNDDASYVFGTDEQINITQTASMSTTTALLNFDLTGNWGGSGENHAINIDYADESSNGASDSVINMTFYNTPGASPTYRSGLEITANAVSSLTTTITDAIIINSEGAGTTIITDAVDASDSDIVNAINIGANVILGTTGTIDFTNFDVSSNGNVWQTGGINALGDQGSMVPNTGFEIYTTTSGVADGWAKGTSGTAAVAITTSSPAQGTNSQTLQANSGANWSWIYSLCFPITGGQTYNMYDRIKSNTTTTTGHYLRLATYTTLANCTALSSATNYDSVSNAGVSTSYAFAGGAITPASTQLWAQVIIFNFVPNVTSTFTVDSVRVTPSALTTGVDVAEQFPANPDNIPDPGDIVTLGQPSSIGIAYVTKTTNSYDQKVLGVVSTNPGLTLDDGQDYTKVPIALAGRVLVKVSTENGPIEVGDPLTSSSTPGVAMKATKSGPIVGKALEGFNPSDPSSPSETSQSSFGKIMVFVSVGWYVAPLETSDPQPLTSFDAIDAQKLTAGAVAADKLVIGGNETDLNRSNQIATDSARLLNTEITNDLVATISAHARTIWTNSAGQIIAWVNDLGEAFFKTIDSLVINVRKLIVKDEVVVAKEAKISGTASFSPGDTEVKIDSDKVNADSLIYVTSTTKTGGLVLYIKEKVPGQSFTVALEKPPEASQLGVSEEATPSAPRPIELNWLIINQE